MSETIQIDNCTAVIRELRKARWPDGKWIVFCGALEASGPTREDAIYNFKRLIGARDMSDIGNMTYGLRDNAEDLFKIWMFQPSRRSEFGRKEIEDIRNTVVGLNAILMQHDKQPKLKVVQNG